VSNVHVILDEDTNGDLVDIEYFHHACAPAGAKEWPAPEPIDYPVYCGECSGRVEEVGLTDDGVAYCHERGIDIGDGWTPQQDCRDDNHSDYADYQDAPEASWQDITCPDCGMTYKGVPEDERGPVLRYFPWDDDVVIPFTLNADDDRVVTSESALQMVRSIIWHVDHPEGGLDLTAGQAIVDIAQLVRNILYPGVKPPREVESVVLPDYGIDECREDGTDL